MRILFIDIDTLRADHLGCYGYKRNTSPTIDQVAAEGTIFSNYYCPNAPCLPSRASLITGQYGIHTGIVGHGGTAADLRLTGEKRRMQDPTSNNNLFMQFRKAGFNTVSFSTFAERHSAWWFNAGLNECHNVGMGGIETAPTITNGVLNWLNDHGSEDNWMMHIHFWDPHTPYRTPENYHVDFENAPLPDDWITENIFQEHLLHIGPHGANEINMWDDSPNKRFSKHPGSLKTLQDAKHMIDLYDESIRYTDDNIKEILDCARKIGIYNDDLAIIITSDHGEDMGELGIYGEHGTADYPVCRIPMIIKWPSTCKGRIDTGLFTNVDLLPTIQDLLGISPSSNYHLDGISYANSLTQGKDCGRDNVVLTQCAHVCQRSVRFDNYIYIRTIHGGGHLFPREMLFDIEKDPHQICNLAPERPDICAIGAQKILDWTEEMMATSQNDADPLWTVIREGGPEHFRGELSNYIKRLEGTPREFGIPLLKERYLSNNMF